MATTARRRDPDDDIAAIAKQISDQAEAIYQNWKSRGLGPADLLTCHAAGDTTKLGSMLKPQPPSKPASLDILAQAPTMDNNRLEKLVKNFVDEDKARIAAARNKSQSPVTSPVNKMPSSIQYALQKFEKGSSQTDSANGVGVRDGGSGAGSYLRKTATLPNRKVGVGSGGLSGLSGGGNSDSGVGVNSYNSSSTTNFVQHQQPVKPAIGQKPQISPKPRLSDTIEMTLPPDVVTGAGLQTWPLKNRVIGTDNVKKSAGTTGENHIGTGYLSTKKTSAGGENHVVGGYQGIKKLNGDGENHIGSGYHKSQPSSVTIDQVALEEKRLINALKNGEVVSDEPVRTIGKLSRDITPIKQPPTTKEPPPPEKLIDPAVPTTTPINSSKWGLRSTPRRPEQQVPHPELTTSQRQHLRQSAASNPVRPFLTRGSVAERVLIFERCPSDLLLDKRVRAPVPQITKTQPLPKQPPLQHTTLQRHVRAHRNVNIPRFHFPSGKPVPPGHLDIIKTKVTAAFAKIGERASREHFGALTQATQLPLYWKTPLYLAACADKGSCTLEQFMTFFQSMSSHCHDGASRFIYILTRGRRSWLAPEDFIPLVQDVVETHPGLTFLKEATEFHSRYVHTVIARIYYCVNRSWSGKITTSELRRSNLLNIIQLLEDEEDINQITQFFSYEHFYVIYCKFWELDRDHDLFIDKHDLTRHNDHALSTRIIDRIFSGCVTRGHKKHQDERMSYTDFVWFLLSEEDKLHPTAIEYWFRCMDLDGDGYLSMYELEYFYDEQMHRMESIGIETLPFQDCLCQMLDMVKPKIPGKIALSDLKKCRMTSIFYDTFFNLEKYLDHEQRDPFASQRDHDIDGQEMSDWDRYAAEEYELLVAEEGGNDQPDSLEYDCGFDRLIR
ncbi:serine/threonine-protein phosphatase 2A regulatory subunit B'' subunit alpha-like isoform X2 [Diabrotica virgifera virgifera]|uniref:Serine/threonine-protein phosphatase 2A regulatory subunit B'' subunit alpha-like isoform X2 n=1 Tax=Diabrotica virgifera virgifera TaxID=50390 RepID=A0A6P7GI75_DIAVI|nr:serine/threonine-protein phosphatase 2A regulatory subunit B'' subunit alpha-like isoform X2 [Diabrotica virgifera virgifera]